MLLSLNNAACDECKHFKGEIIGEAENEQRWICAAFKNGIPKEILFGENNHEKPVAGDGGIVFELDE